MSQTDDEFVELVKELFDEFLPEPNATYIEVPITSNPNRPWEFGTQTKNERDIRLIFVPSEIENRRYRNYRQDTEIAQGSIRVFVDCDFELFLTGMIKFQNKIYSISAIDKIAPLNKDLVWVLTLQT